ncbi:hypothetical protein FOR85_11135 [Psychrobacter sp. YGAH215]|uniref:hypothetical protein n=1 Tax=Psychrobacter sp. YGAH215 TaxID=2596826 RepID=UPI0011853596|nr:hypothetical protein [Psychrobacter sp. YGAH215]TSB22091.1 hypothetical protein FOR85_11135 [Psychrobacter sp. YGAH215]
MRKFVLDYPKGSYRKLFIVALILSFGFFIASFIDRDIPNILIWLGLFLAALKQVVIPINLDQKISLSKKRYSISDDDFISHYNGSSIMHNNNKGKTWYKWIILGDDISSLLLIGVILYIIFG